MKQKTCYFCVAALTFLLGVSLDLILANNPEPAVEIVISNPNESVVSVNPTKTVYQQQNLPVKPKHFAAIDVRDFELNVVSRTSIYDNADFVNPLPALEQVVKEKAKTKKNTFYISQIYTFSNKYSNAWVYWKEGNALILWEPYQMGSDNRIYELVWSRRFLDLATDVVPTEKDIGGSTYLVTRQWARQKIAACKKMGIEFVFYKKLEQTRKSQFNK